MAYAPAGSTAGANPPMLIVQPMALGGGSTFGSTILATLLGGKIWYYCSTHLQTDVGTSDFISDGQKLGMKQRDLLIHNSLSSGVSLHRCNAEPGATYAGFSAGLMLASAS